MRMFFVLLPLFFVCSCVDKTPSSTSTPTVNPSPNAKNPQHHPKRAENPGLLANQKQFLQQQAKERKVLQAHQAAHKARWDARFEQRATLRAALQRQARRIHIPSPKKEQPQ